MTLSPGNRLGPYEITGDLGAGGMGEVYRGRDATLNRDVAIKVLPASLASDPERLTRFKREAQVLASLNHPNVAHVYGFEGATLPDGSTTHFLAMELVLGEDLSERLRRGAIPVDEAIAIAKQIAEGLEEAHEHGIIHRDLKPANVKVTPEGKVKVLDFGLAKALEADPTSSAANSRLSHSPTMSRHATEAGMIMGTAAYMSPEQARGKAVDKRADIWSFGVVLFEMLTGTRLFGGETVSDTLAAVLTREPAWDALPAGTPDAVRRLLVRCLDRDPKNRLRDIGDARLEIARLEAGGSDRGAAPVVVPARRRLTGLAVASIAGFTVAGFGLGLGLARTPFLTPATNLTRVTSTVLLPPDVRVNTELPPTRSGGVAVSLDGRHIAFASLAKGRSQIFVRDVDSEVARAVAGTEGGTYPSWSPDGRRIAFAHRQEYKLKLVSADGGLAQVITEMTNPRSAAAWGPDDTLLFHREFFGPLMRVASAGGPTSEVLPAVGKGGAWFSPVWLPGGRRFLVIRFAYSDAHSEGAGIYAGTVGSIDLTLLVPGRIAEVAFGNDELFYRKGAELIAQPFNSSTLKILGAPRVISNHAFMAAAGGPTLVYFAPPGGLSQGNRIAWFSRSGSPLPFTGEPGTFRDPRISPDGRFLAIARADQNGLFGISKYDIVRNLDSRVSGATISGAAWGADSRTIVGVDFGQAIMRFDATASAPPQPIRALVNGYFLDVSPDGRDALFALAANDKREIAVAPLDGSVDVRSLSGVSGASVEGAAWSPDGKWIAIDGREGNTYRLYAWPCPGPGESIPVTAMSARYARWRGDGRELYFLSESEGDKTIMAVDVTWSGGVPAFGPARALFKIPAIVVSNFAFDVTTDGQRFVAVLAGDPDPSPLTMVMATALEAGGTR